MNAADIKADPPAHRYLVVNWGDGPNQRVGCGPCRQDHGYAPGSYTLVASSARVTAGQPLRTVGHVRRPDLQILG